MRRPSVEVTVAGQSFRIVASEGEEAVRRYAEQVQERLQQVGGGRQSVHPQAMLLAAMALAHDLEQEKARHAETRQQAAQAVEAMLRRVDDALGGVDDDGKALSNWRAQEGTHRTSLAASSADQEAGRPLEVGEELERTLQQGEPGVLESTPEAVPGRDSDRRLVGEEAALDPDADFVRVRRDSGSATQSGGSGAR